MKPKNKLVTAVILVLLSSFIFVNLSFAQGLVPCGRRTAPDTQECKLEHLFILIYRVISFLLSLVGLIAILYILWGGLQMLTAGGNQDLIGAARTTLTNAVTGLVIVLSAYIIVGLVVGLLLGPSVGPNWFDALEKFRK